MERSKEKKSLNFKKSMLSNSSRFWCCQKIRNVATECKNRVELELKKEKSIRPLKHTPLTFQQNLLETSRASTILKSHYGRFDQIKVDFNNHTNSQLHCRKIYLRMSHRVFPAKNKR